ncbi:CLUMA_CG013996, isoform A [Clunio marinus]|uniref:DNA repair protein RAD50 n=1 Tax=Clunio marinus TaxID=568069 RepID=A0A1J1IMF2_9DIPT|nr:CLUMA_CG013996, isoform A [Clunio marinus]
MSTINRLSICGIRSFGIEKEDEQKINFTSPLTLIVGENGCGKTTIIECLKYGITGEAPTGSDKGKTFVHDPKVFSTPSSLGRIKLVVTDAMGNTKLCTRSMKMDIQKNGKPKFETLDCTISTTNILSGKPEESRKRVHETNEEMCAFMGVSKAILNNVIFCHQEDSCWPLDEGKKLKEKFDAIFGTTEYNKAIDKLMKYKKEYDEKFKTCAIEKRHLEGIKKDADRKLLELDILNHKHRETEAEADKLKAQIEPLEGEIEKLLMKHKQIGKLSGKQTVFKCQIASKKSDIAKYQKLIKNPMNGNIEELEIQLENYSKTLDDNEQRLESLNNEKNRLVNGDRKKQELFTKISSTSDNLADEISKKQSLIDQRFDATKELSSKLGISFSDSDDRTLSEDENILSSLLEQIRQGIANKGEEIKVLSTQQDDKENEYQKKIDKVREDKVAIETNIATQKQRKLKITKDYNDMKREITSIESSLPGLDEMIQQIKSTEVELGLFPTESIEKDFKKKVQIFNDKIDKELKQIVVEIDEANKKISLKKSKRDHLQNVIEEKEEKLKAMKKRINKLCDGLNFSDVFAKQKEKKEKLSMDLAYLKSSENTFKHYISDIEQDPCCPLCHKDLDQRESVDLKDEISEKIRQLPSRIADTERKLKSESKKFDELNEVKSIHENIEQDENEIKKLNDDLEKLDEDYRNLLEDLEGYEIQVAEPQLKQKLITPLQINASHSKLNGLQLKLNNLVSQKMMQQGLDQKKKTLDEKKNEIAELDRKILLDEKKLQPLEKELREIINAKENIKKTAKENISRLQKALERIKINQADLERMNKEIENYENARLEQKYKEAQEKKIEIKKALKDLQDDIKSKSSDIKRLETELTNQSENKRILQDNIELRRSEKELETLQDEYEKLMKEIGDLDVDKLIKEKRTLESSRDEIRSEYQTLQGRISESLDRIAQAKKECNEPKYKNAKINYLKECYIQSTLKAMREDLLKYRKALEKSLMKFHGDKMKEINQRIRDLWNNIYKGNDIDYIEIKTDEDDSKGSDKKRTYHYRVIQAKNGGGEIDMRGRCSAGQKVLASLIIRMALADTFSANCGVLALDEPTTNLDVNNIQALCTALVNIVEEREKTGQFMLVVITHDEDFVQTLQRVDHYYKLSRDGKGRSRIEKMTNK